MGHEQALNDMLGLLKIKVKKGVDLAVRDVCSSDPYVFIAMGNQRLKTRVIRKDVNPEWDEDLTLSITDRNQPVTLTVYDHDTFTTDDTMGDAEIDIRPYLDALKVKREGLPNGSIINKIYPDRQNCLAEESQVIWKDGHVTQDMCLRLRHVETGEVHIRLQWIDLLGYKPLS